MYENISLIKEVHEHLSIKEAQRIAHNYLSKIGLEHIGLYRVSQCKHTEILYTMFIRALMTKHSNVIIASPFSLARNIKDIKDIIKDIELLNNGKNIIIIDTLTNENRYKGVACHIIK